MLVDKRPFGVINKLVGRRTRRLARLASAAREAGRLDVAAKIYMNAYSFDRNLSVLRQLANCLKDDGRFAEAYTRYDESARLGSRDADLYLQLGHLFKRSFNLGAARAAFEKALAYGDADAPYELQNLATFDLGALEPLRFARLSRIAGLAIASERRPELAQTLVSLEQGLLSEGNYSDAELIAKCRRLTLGFVELTPDDPTPITASDLLFDLIDIARAHASEAEISSKDEPSFTDVAFNSPGLNMEFAPLTQAALQQTIDAVDYLLGAGDEDPGLDKLVRALGSGPSAHVILDGEIDGKEAVSRLAMNAAAAHFRKLVLLAEGGVSIKRAQEVNIVLNSARAQGAFLHLSDPVRLLDLLNVALHRVPDIQAETVRLITLNWLTSSLGFSALVDLFEREIALFEKPLSIKLIKRRVSLDRDLDVAALLKCVRVLKQAGYWTDAADLIKETPLGDANFDLLMELGIIEKTNGNFEAAAKAFIACVSQRPDADSLWNELALVALELPQEHPAVITLRHQRPQGLLPMGRGLLRDARVHDSPALDEKRHMSPKIFESLLPRVVAVDVEPGIILWIGTESVAVRHGGPVVLGGVESVRARVVSGAKLRSMRVRLNGQTIATQDAGTPTTRGAHGSLFEYIFNLWVDVGSVSPGTYELQVHFQQVDSGYSTVERLVQVEGGDFRDHNSGNFVPPPGLRLSARELEKHVKAQPTRCYNSDRRFPSEPPKRILIVRADQLGDFVTSVPAIDRIRAAFPDALIDALVIPSNSSLADSLGVFDRVFSVDLKHNPTTGRRELGAIEQQDITMELCPRRYEVAIDLSPGIDTRPLLALSGSRLTVGFKARDFPWLDYGIELITRDPHNGRETISHARHVNSLADAFIGAFSPFDIVRRNGTPKPVPPHLGLAKGRFVVLHAGARLEIKRWPTANFVELAALFAEHTDLTPVLITDAPLDPLVSEGLPERAVCLSGRIVQDEFDSLLENSALFVGNDTGPKHLAAMRGARVLSIHMGQVNWQEWGQDGIGAIMVKHVPCYGCGIERANECGQDLACLVEIKPSEVLSAGLKIIGGYSVT